MNTYSKFCVLAALLCAPALFAQPSPSVRTNSGTYASDIGAVSDAQEQALAQAKDMLEQTQSATARTALNSAIQDMERAKTALAQAQNSPDKLPAAIAAQQAAYQALLKMLPREFSISRSRNNRGQSGQQRAGDANRNQVDQLEMQDEQNRYETERQAQAAPNEQQREQLQTADRLKELAQRQQDLNDRLKELQTTLPEARTQQERDEAQRQLKRLSDEERQMLSDMDELRQQMEQSPNASSQANTRQQLDQTRSDAQRAAQEMENQSPSQALAAGSRAQQGLDNLRQDVRNQTSGRFTDQMRQMRSEARDLASREDDLARGLQSLANPGQKLLDDTAPRQQLSQQLAQQQNALTNLLAQMQSLSEQAETTEPLLSQQLYDTLRKESQTDTENILQAGQQLVDRGLISQAGQVEPIARRNINDLRQGVERAAESVLGNEADSLRFAEKELDDLAGKLQNELAGAGTNSNFEGGSQGGTNSLQRMAQSMSGSGNTNLAANNSPGHRQRGNDGQQANGQNSQRNRQGQGETNSGNERTNNQGDNQTGSEQAQNTPGQNPPGNQPGEANAGNERGNNEGENPGGEPARNGDGQNPQPGEGQGNEAGGGNRTGGDLENLVRQFGGAHGAGGLNYGPLTGNDFVDWSSRMRDVEQALDDPALRNQLATARERAAAMRAEFRQSRIKPKADLVQRQILDPITEVRTQLREDLARVSNANSLVPLDHDPVPDNYSDLVKKYYETLGGSQ